MELSNLVGFSISKVLNESADTKTIFLLGKFERREGDAIVLLEKQGLTRESCRMLIADKSTNLKFTMQNDIFGLYTCDCDVSSVNQIKVTVIHPATSRLVEKFSAHKLHMVRETADDYRLITLPYILECKKDLQWVENILEKKAERDRVLCEDDDPVNGFVLVADMKWNQEQVEELYVLALCRKRDIFSIRDLDGSHVTMLRNIRDKSLVCLKNRYGLEPCQVRAFLHYQPTYYHMHVHFTHTRLQQGSTVVGKAHLLDDVIDNITIISEDYYKKCAISYQLRDSHPLVSRLQAAKDDITSSG